MATREIVIQYDDASGEINPDDVKQMLETQYNGALKMQELADVDEETRKMAQDIPDEELSPQDQLLDEEEKRKKKEMLAAHRIAVRDAEGDQTPADGEGASPEEVKRVGKQIDDIAEGLSDDEIGVDETTPPDIRRRKKYTAAVESLLNSQPDSQLEVRTYDNDRRRLYGRGSF